MKGLGLVIVLGALSAAGDVFRAKLGETVTLKCAPKGTTESVKWNHENILVIRTLKSGQTAKGPAVMKDRATLKHSSDLEISTVKREDAGEFTCETPHPVKHTLLVVSVSASPSGQVQTGSSVELHCEVQGLKPTSRVQWKRPDGRLQVPSQTCKLEVVALSDTGTWTCVFSYDGKEYTEPLKIEVKEPTPEPTTLSATQTSKIHHDSSRPNSGNNVKGLLLRWWKWIVAGVCCLVLVFLVIVIIFCKRIRRKKKLQMLRTGRQSLRPKKYCQCDQPTAARKPQQGRQKGKPSAPVL